MREKFSWRKMAYVFAFSLLVTVPSILVAGYGVYRLRSWLAGSYGFVVPDPVYLTIVYLAIVGAGWLSSGHFIRSFREPEPKDRRSRW
jgi:hypothetical protein